VVERKIKPEKKKGNVFSFVFPACLGMGVGLGALMHNVGVGLGIGVAVGTTLSLLAEYYLDRKS
jgi:hypothetical protein